MPLIIGFLAGAIVGGLVRVLLHRVLRGRRPSDNRWVAELAAACVLGGAISVPVALFIDAREWGMGFFIAGMTAYAAASAALAYRRAATGSANPRASAFAHFAAAYLVMLAAFVIVVNVMRLVST